MRFCVDIWLEESLFSFVGLYNELKFFGILDLKICLLGFFFNLSLLVNWVIIFI